jgi:predicted nucleic acid-binding protein
MKKDEPLSDRCAELIRKIPGEFQLTEPSIIYAEVCGTLARRVSTNAASEARGQLDRIINQDRIAECDKSFCVSASALCHEYSLYAVDALYLKTALDNHAILVSLDRGDFIDKVKGRASDVEAYHPSQFPY